MPAFQFDLLSFFLGLVTGLAGAFLVFRIWKAFPQLVEFIRLQLRAFKNRSTADLEYSIRRSTIKRAQRGHLAASLFSLDEIIIAPRFLTQPVYSDPSIPSPEKNVTGKTIDFLLDFPDLASQYPCPTLNTSQLLTGGANFFLISRPGYGKSFALANIASMYARQDKDLGQLAGCVPLYIHVHDVNLIPGDQEILQRFYQSLEQEIPHIRKPLLPAYLKDHAEQGSLVLILDGLDELDHADFDMVCQLLTSLLKLYPKIRVITTAPMAYWGSLGELGFFPVGIAQWNQEERSFFVHKWLESWKSNISAQLMKNSVPDLNDEFLAAWIQPNSPRLSPFEWTLRLWEISSNDKVNSEFGYLVAYINRLGGSKVAAGLLERLALTFLKSPAGLIERKIAEEAIIKSHGHFGTVEITQNEQATKGPKAPPLINSGSEIIRALLVTGLLKQNSAGFLSFSHSLVLGFLGRTAIEEEFFSQIKSASKYSLRDRVVLYFSGNLPAGEAVYLNLLEYDEAPFHNNLVELLEYTRYTSWSAAWKNEVIRYAVRVVHDPTTPGTIIGSLLAACLDDSPGMVSLLRQLIGSSSELVRKNALLSLGCIPDPKSTSDFVKCLNDANPEVKIAACLALANHAAAQSFQYAIKILSEGDETSRQAVAECLACRGKDGAAALTQASQSPNLLTRRAAVFGLAEVHQEWALDLLKKIAVGDNQWLVRNAASHLIENEGSPRLSPPQKMTAPSDTPWLIEAAAKQNIGIAPGHPATEILSNILENGPREQKLAAIGLLSSTPSELRGISEINKQTACGDSEIEEYALITLWNLEKSSLSD